MPGQAGGVLCIDERGGHDQAVNSLWLVSDEAHMHPHAISTGEISKATIQPQLHTHWHTHTYWPRRALAPRVRRIRFRYVLDHGYGLLECQWLWYHGCVTAV